MVSILKRLSVLLLLAPALFGQANLPSGTTASGTINYKNIAAPSTPASGRTITWTDSTSKLFCAKNDAGTLSCTVIASSAPSHQFFNSLSAGSFGSAQPAFSDISGSLSCAQLPSFTGDLSNTACAVTVTALHLGSTPTLCSSGNYARGIDANGNSTGCTSANSGTVTSIATTSPITGGTITSSGTIACATCAIGPGSSTTNHLAKFSGTDGITLADGGAIPAGSVTSVGFTVNSGSSSGVFTVTGSPVTSSGTLDVATAGTSGGIPYFSSSSVLSSSGALTNHALVLGGGAGATPTALGSLGTTTTVLHGNAAGAPSFGAVANADLTNSATTVNGQTCTLGSTCTITTGAGGGVLANTTFRRWALYAENGVGNSSIGETAPDFSGTFGSEIASSTTCGPSRTTVTSASNGSTAVLGDTTKKNWKAGKSPSIRMQINVSTTSNVRAWAAAFTDSTMTGSATPAGNWLAFRFDTGAGDTSWNACTSASGTSGCTPTGVSVDTTNCQFFQIDFTSGTNAVFYINGASVATIATNLPSSGTMMGWFAGVTTLANSAVTFKYSFFYMDESPW